jgi:DKNYY family
MTTKSLVTAIAIVIATSCLVLIILRNGLSNPGSPDDGTENHNYFTKNSQGAFYRGTPIVGADLTTFTALNDPYGHDTLFSKDAYHVYISNPQSANIEILQGADPRTFEVLMSLTVSCVPERQSCEGDFPFAVILAKDGQAVYGALGGRIKGADPTSFETLKTPDGAPSVFAQDKDHIYAGSLSGDATIIAADRKSFHVISETEAQDNSHVYFEDSTVSSN